MGTTNPRDVPVKQSREDDVKEKKKSRRVNKPAAKPAEAPHKTREAPKPASETTVERWVNMLLIRAVREGASDIHIEERRQGLSVHFRVDGTLRLVQPPEQSLPEGVLTRIKKMARMKLEDERLPRDGHYGAIVDGREVDFAVHSLPTSHGESLTIRLRDCNSLVPLGKLGFEPAALTSLRKIMAKPRGLILVVGPSGSGKTTTLYAMLSELAERDKKVVAIEYPIEFNLSNVTQSQVDPRSGYDYPAALRVITRQDPDVVMVGNLGDAATAHAALQTTLGGRLVLTSMTAGDAAEAISGLLGLGVDPFLLATGLEGIIAQRVLRRVCPSCKQSVAPTSIEKQFLGLKPGQKLTKGRGCEECKGTGYRGRVGVLTVVPVTDALRDLVLSRPQPSALRQSYGAAERKLLIPAGMAKAKAGITTLREVVLNGGLGYLMDPETVNDL
jgi:general secretion pathway protein E